jgi:hypothetical protein
MTVAELIKELTDLCEGKDPSTVDVMKVVDTTDMWGADYEHISLDTAGGNVYPLVILVK